MMRCPPTYAGHKRSVHSTNTGTYRSVVDYDTEEDLRRAMVTAQAGGDMSDGMLDMITAIKEGQPVQKVARTHKDQNELHEQLEWVLPYFDPATTQEEYMEKEIKRLQCVKSYVLLDDRRREEAFERITALAARIFDVPMAVISLIDLGRQWLVSYLGIDAEELHRKDAVCAQTIMAESNFLVIPDLSKDSRFRDVITVSGPPHLRFYAAASLVSPEGYRLGTFCITDPAPRPQGLTPEQTRTLIDLADMTVKVMVDRRFQLEKERTEDPERMIAYTANDLLAPLNGIQLSLSMLKDDDEITSTLSERQAQLLNAAASRSELAVRMWQGTLDGLRRIEESRNLKGNGVKAIVARQQRRHSGGTKIKAATTRLGDLVQNLQATVDLMAQRVPVLIELDPSTPNEIVADDLKLFRCTLNLLNCAMNRVKVESVRLTIRQLESTVLFECEDHAEDIPVEQYEHLYQNTHCEAENRVGLMSVVSLVKSMDGEYGFRPRGIDPNGNVLTDVNACRQSGSVFWFSISLVPVEKEDTQAVVQSSQPPLIQSTPSMPAAILDPSITAILAVDRGVEATKLLDMGLGFESDPTCKVAKSCDDAIASLAATMVTTVDAGAEDEGDKLTSILEQLENLEPYPAPFPGGNTRARRRRVLIIDDSMVVRKNLVQVVNGLGYDAVQAVNGLEGLQELQLSLFDIVFCDFSMPLMDGLTCISTYRDWEEIIRPWDRQFIVGISEHPHLNESGQGQQAGMDSFYPKPITAKNVSDIQSSSDAVIRTEKLDELEANKQLENVVSDDLSGPEAQSYLGANSISAPSPFPIHSSGNISKPDSAATAPMCLVAATIRTASPDPIPHLLESQGWNVISINHGPDCLKLLQARIWDAVLIDDDLPQLAGVACISAFRQWEAQNRASVQKNVFLVCGGYVPSPSDTKSLVQLPNGCNGVLSRPVPLSDFDFMYQRSTFRGDGEDQL